MQHISAIIIEDDEFSAEQLKDLLAKNHNTIQVLQVCSTGEQAKNALLTLSPDIVFLDIELPDMSGFELLKALPNINFEVIFTTAFDQYAINAIRFSALDYLLKPISAEQLQTTITKASAKLKEKSVAEQFKRLFSQLENRDKPLENLGIPTMEGILFLKIADIVKCESYDKYTKIFCMNKKMIISSRNLGEFEDLLGQSGFIRVHKSFLVNKNHIVRYIKGEGGQVEMADQSYVDVSRRSKSTLLQAISNFR
jgi:two-component system LytT family response regulator